MKYLLSMDGGGSKTAWLLTTETGIVSAQYCSDGCARPALRVPEVLFKIYSGIDTLLNMAGVSKSDVLSAAFGVPCYGEYPDEDQQILQSLQQYLAPTAVTVCNDVMLAFAGSLCLDDGIHLVAGTGAIAIGRNSAGQTATCNGWHPVFSDEGSGYWLGMQMLSLFCKQADHRIPRGPLYRIVRRELMLEKDMDIISYYDQQLSGNRKKTAALQLLLKEATAAGDPSAIQLYEAAAYELFLTIRSIYHTLSFSGTEQVKISYSGGLFSDGNFLMAPLKQYLTQLPAQLIPPAFPPVYGGILLAMQNISHQDVIKLCKSFRLELSKEVLHGNH